MSSKLLAASLGIVVTQTFGISIEADSTWETYKGKPRHGGGYHQYKSSFGENWLDNYHGSSWGKKDSKFAEHVLSDLKHHELDAEAKAEKWREEARKR